MSCKCGNSNCVGVCNYSIGARLYYYFNNAKFISTNIGDIEKDTLDERQTFIVIGAESEENSIGKIMVPTGNCDIPIGSKINNRVDIKKMLVEYINKSGLDGKDILDRLVKFDTTNKLLPMPLEVGTRVDVTCKGSKGETIVQKTKISKVRWKVDSKDKRLKCHIVTDAFDLETNTRLVLLLEEYGDKFVISNDFGFYNKANLSSNLIKFNRNGYVLPIELKSEGGSIIIDNASVYVKKENDYKAEVVGGWVDNKIVINNSAKRVVSNSKLYKAISNNNVYIKFFRNCIIPYLVADTNVVTVKK